MKKIRELNKLEGAEINKAKEILAFEVTKLIHGEEEAIKAQNAAKALFEGEKAEGSIPFTEFKEADFEKGIGILDLLKEIGLTKSNGEGRRLIEQGGVSIEDEKLEDINKIIGLDDFKDGKLMFRKGKKVYHLVKLV
jgi:tyrosyl-tRNA synthetase